jgi:hypothetical protein
VDAGCRQVHGNWLEFESTGVQRGSKGKSVIGVAGTRADHLPTLCPPGASGSARRERASLASTKVIRILTMLIDAPRCGR